MVHKVQIELWSLFVLMYWVSPNIIGIPQSNDIVFYCDSFLVVYDL